MARNRVLVQYPLELIQEIDRIAGEGKRTSYLVDLAKREIELHQQKQALMEAAESWKYEDHPELAQGSEAWLRGLRHLGDERFRQIEENRETE